MEIAVACIRTPVPIELARVLDGMYPTVERSVNRMLKNRELSSSKHWPEIPCVVSKSLIAKYQRNPLCKKLSHAVIPVCGDKGRQIKTVAGGVRIPALFKKQILPVVWRATPVGEVRNVEFLKRKGQWFAHFCINVSVMPSIIPAGVVGVDRNMRGNVAVLADPVIGKVRHLGPDYGGLKFSWRKRKARLQRAGRNRLLHRVRRKQSRRTKDINHKVSKQVVDYASKHCRAIALENLGGISGESSKCRQRVETGQWSFRQLEDFIVYKSALAGVPVVFVDPAFTSQTCSKCGSRHKPSGKVFACKDCGHRDHRDANAAFNIAAKALSAHRPLLSESGFRSADSPASGNPNLCKV